MDEIEEVIKAYVYTQGNRKPEGWWQKEDSDICFFCDKIHNNHLLSVPKNNRTGEMVRMHLCHSCDVILGDLEDDGSYSSPSLAPKKNKAIEYHVVTGSLDSGRILKLLYGLKILTTCYFCNTNVAAVGGANYIKVPTGVIDKVVPKIKCCNTCKEEINKTVQERINASKVIYTGIKRDICFGCGGDHCITTNEYRMREVQGTLGKHICYSCFPARLFEYSRFYPIKCKTCEQNSDTINSFSTLDITNKEHDQLLFFGGEFVTPVGVDQLCEYLDKDCTLKSEEDMSNYYKLPNGTCLKVKKHACEILKKQVFGCKVIDMENRVDENGNYRKMAEIIIDKHSCDFENCIEIGNEDRSLCKCYDTPHEAVYYGTIKSLSNISKK